MASELTSSFDFHTHCEFCTQECELITIELPKYIMVTNVWNERSKIEVAFKRLQIQTKKPILWIWIDDGSTDGTSDEIESVSSKYPEFNVWILKMPEKKIGDINTIGRAYSRFMPEIIKRVDNLGIEFFTIQDVGTQPCPNYFARIISLMMKFPRVGVSAGTVIGEEIARESGLPMGDCKVTRWRIIREIQTYWDLAPDTFVNIKALKKGYNLGIWRVPVKQDNPTFGLTSKGLFRAGQRNYYVGRPFLGVLIRAIRRLFLRKHGTQMLRGYFHEWIRGEWHCDDSDVKEFYGSGKSFIWTLVEIVKTKGRYS
ncbi:MAG: glycosyltransferase family A protein [Candidatus Thorarchaeota archaeon]